MKIMHHVYRLISVVIITLAVLIVMSFIYWNTLSNNRKVDTLYRIGVYLEDFRVAQVERKYDESYISASIKYLHMQLVEYIQACNCVSKDEIDIWKFEFDLKYQIIDAIYHSQSNDTNSVLDLQVYEWLENVATTIDLNNIEPEEFKIHKAKTYPYIAMLYSFFLVNRASEATNIEMDSLIHNMKHQLEEYEKNYRTNHCALPEVNDIDSFNSAAFYASKQILMSSTMLSTMQNGTVTSRQVIEYNEILSDLWLGSVMEKTFLDLKSTHFYHDFIRDLSIYGEQHRNICKLSKTLGVTIDFCIRTRL